jgi:hypothetical protein
MDNDHHVKFDIKIYKEIFSVSMNHERSKRRYGMVKTFLFIYIQYMAMNKTYSINICYVRNDIL